MQVTFYVSRNRVFTPAPERERPGEEFEPATWRGKATSYFTVDTHADQTTAFGVAVGTGNRNHIGRCGFRSAREDATKKIFANVFEFFRRDDLLVNRANLLCNFKRAIAAHELKRIQIFCGSFFRQARHRVFEDPAVILIDAKSRARVLPGFDKLANA